MERSPHRSYPLKTGYLKLFKKSCKKGSLIAVGEGLICKMEKSGFAFQLRCLLIWALLCAQVAFAQPLNKDSLLNRLSSAKNDSNKVKLLINLANAFKNSDLPKARNYCNEALTLSRSLKFTRGIFLSMANDISITRLDGNDSLALIKCRQYLTLAEETADPYYLGVGNLNLAEVTDNMGDNVTAVAYALKGLSIAEKLNRQDLLQDAYACLQRLYYSRTEFDKAIFYGKKAIDLALLMKDRKRYVTQSYNLAFTYNITKQFDSSIALSREVIAASQEIGETRIESYAWYNLASISLRNDKVEDALKYAKQCLQLAKNNSDKAIEGSCLTAIASALMQLKKNKEAEDYLLQALKLKEQADDQMGIAEVKAIMANLYFALGEPKKAYALVRESEDFSDAYNESVLSKQSSDLEKKYESEKKDVQIRSQQMLIRQKNILNYILLGSALLLATVLLLAYRNFIITRNLQRQRIAELETEKQLTATEAVLKGEEQERTRLAKDLHDGLGGMLSGIKYSFNAMKGNLIMTPENAQAFERSMDMLDSSIKEMRRVAHNMMPEALVKFGLDVALKDFCHDINQSGALKVTYQSINMEGAAIHESIAITVYRIVQELLNNSIKHSEATSAVVQISKEGPNLNVTVEDDGKGFNVDILQRAQGIGWSNIQNRVGILKGKIDVQSKAGAGTSVFIELKT
ncbi:MAG: tetratricopeptide repeat protein [Chitinophagaceae bacterium]|nr:MAG: tetratricopeptide repeat protein [Chitinophagaceae bacterium]